MSPIDFTILTTAIGFTVWITKTLLSINQKLDEHSKLVCLMAEKLNVDLSYTNLDCYKKHKRHI